MTHPSKLILLASLTLSLIALTSLLNPIAQNLDYHHFADQRMALGLPNLADVSSNALFTVFGLMGLWQIQITARRTPFEMRGEKSLWLIFFAGATLVGVGSAYYHLDPTNATLVWDRLPMTIAFMSFFSLVIMERIDPRTGAGLSPVLLLIGAGSVFYWDYSEGLGQGDLRPYILVQFLPLLLIPLMLWLFPARYSGVAYLGQTVLWYVLAKLCEHFDAPIFSVLGGTVSGHTLKHLVAAMGVYSMVLYIKNRQRIV